MIPYGYLKTYLSMRTYDNQAGLDIYIYMYHNKKNRIEAKIIYGEDGTASPFACNNCVVSPPCGAHGKK